jgi:hypothetical protein
MSSRIPYWDNSFTIEKRSARLSTLGEEQEQADLSLEERQESSSTVRFHYGETKYDCGNAGETK